MSETEIFVDYEYFEDTKPGDPCIVYNKDLSEEKGSQHYSIKHLDQIAPYLVVCCADIENGTNDYSSFFWCTKCLRYPKEGVVYPDGTIISLGYKIDGHEYYKGLRGKVFATPTLKVFVGGNKICMRISQNTLYFTGKMTTEGRTRVVEVANQILADTRKFWDNCISNPEDFLEAAVWLEKNCYKDKSVIMTEKDGSISHPFYWPASCPEHLHYFVSEIVERYSDVWYSAEIITRTLEIIRGEEFPCYPNLTHIITRTSLVRYTYNLGFGLSEREAVQELRKKGYFVQDHNVERKNIRVEIVDKGEYDDDNTIQRKGPKLYSQIMSISVKGTIQHSGPGGQRHEAAYYRIMKDLISIFA